MKRISWIVWIALILCLASLGYGLYRHVRRERELTGGAIQSEDLMTPSEKAEYDRRRDADRLSHAQQMVSSKSLSQNEIEPGMATPSAEVLAPGADSAMYAGRGRFQWYRQGNLTWRLDTETGKSCVVYATLEEWRNPLVKSHGCNER